MRIVRMLAAVIAAVVLLYVVPAADAQTIPAVPIVCPPFTRGTGSATPPERRIPVRFARNQPRAERQLIVPRPCSGIPTAAAGFTTSPPPQSATFFSYVRMGEGALFADRKYLTPAIGFGVRTELDSFAIDSSLNLQVRSNGESEPRGVVAGSVVNLKVLRYAEPAADASIYLGGGLSWGGVDLDGSGPMSIRGDGLQSEVVAGYEFARKSAIRMFVETNAVLPLYEAATTTRYLLPASAVVHTASGHRYAPSLIVSFGVGWQRQ